MNFNLEVYRNIIINIKNLYEEVKALLLTCKKTFMGFAKRKA